MIKRILATMSLYYRHWGFWVTGSVFLLGVLVEVSTIDDERRRYKGVPYTVTRNLNHLPHYEERLLFDSTNRSYGKSSSEGLSCTICRFLSCCLP